jgi:hypothetical protein
MRDRKALTVVRAYPRAWSTKDLESVGRYLADDLRVEVPINSYRGKGYLLRAVRRTAEVTSKVTLLAEIGSDEEAILLYDMTLPMGERWFRTGAIALRSKP